MSPARGPRDRFVTVYGRMPVLEVLENPGLAIDKVLISHRAHGPSVDDIVAAARRRGVRVERTSPDRVTRISGNGRHDQGVAADIEAPGVGELGVWLAKPAPSRAACVVILDGVTNPANVGMVLRTAAAFGSATVLPRRGSPDLGPLVIKASAGVAFSASVLRSPTAAEAARSMGASGWPIIGLAAGAPCTIFEPLPNPVALVLGGETSGLSPEAAAAVTGWRSIPLAPGVESLNVAVAAGVALAEHLRQRSAR